MAYVINSDKQAKRKTIISFIAQHPTVFIAIGLLIGLSIVIQVFSAEPCPAEWSLIQRVSVQIMKYFNNWGLPLGAMATFLLALAAIWNIWDTRFNLSQQDKRLRADKLVKWSKDTISSLTVPPKETNKTRLDRIKAFSDQLTVPKIEFMVIVSDAQILGGDVKVKTEIAIIRFLEYTNEIDDALAKAKAKEHIKVGELPPSLPVINALQELIKAAANI